ncbi:hypothetical protein FPZ42_00760 [Mucilaginibacter achroorhodeus]|uniref:DUF6794 domain-containing protein n=1 Tax=Mucilaginibacter achroorhodeus TaxID=2599294 RepID=A0A563U8T6_9SPHI|nr:DUF6794 domain-containing protein [Mucilaginibacter achroorhodeus]TWR27777.1 hypothetical protein FPZ42_00760 [Mucilaginibacter achroorhodeus]
MKATFLTLILFVFAITIAYSQERKSPSNIKQAISILQFELSDSLKLIVKNTEESNLIRLCYPWAAINKTGLKIIYDWFQNNDKPTGLNRYLIKHGITYLDHKQTITLVAFKQYLNNKKSDYKAIIKPYQRIELKWANEDKLRSTTDSLRGVYIPKDLDDALRQLNTFFKDSVRLQAKQLSENEFTARYHFGLGLWLRNNWGLWGGSRLSKYFIDLGINNPEDMSGVILTSYHRQLLQNPIKLAEQIQFSKDYLAKAQKDELNVKTKEFSEYHLNDTVVYKYPYGYVTTKQEDDADNDKCSAKGIVIAKNVKDFLLKVQIIETCDKKGIITYDNIKSYIFDKKIKQWIKAKKRKIIKSHKNEELWMNYNNWEAKESQ